MRYHHIQKAAWFTALLFLPAVILTLVLISEGQAALTPLALLCLIPAWLFSRLVVEIDRRELRCFFGPGWIRRRFALDQIRSVETVRNRWWYGWGIRRAPSAWMFNISGLDAVELTLASGKRFRIGTDEPQQLADAIRAGLEAR